MKNFFNLKSIFRTSLVAFCLLTVGSGNVWAWYDMTLIGDFTPNGWTANNNYKIEYVLGSYGGDGKAHRFLPFYTSSGDKYWRLWGDNRFDVAPLDNNYEIDYGEKYQIKGSHPTYAFKTTVAAGVISVHSNQAMTQDDKTGDVNGTNDEPAVWLERPKIYIWHNWNNNTANWNNNGGSGQKEMTDNQDGTYTYDGQFAGSSDEQNKTNVGIEGSSDIKKYFGPGAPTMVGSPTTGDKCRFTWNSSGYLGKNGETNYRGSLTITKILTITYDGNGNGSGSAPSNEEVLYNTPTATYTNTGNMTKTNMAFIGWNTKADGTGYHYDAGANITLTSNKTLYAEWVPCWMFKGGDSDKPNGSDAMGDWTPQEMTIIGTNAFMIELNLAASTSYQFKIVDRHNGKKDDSTDWLHYGNDGTMSGTTLDWTFATNKNNCTLNTGASGAGTWRFAWNANSKVLCVYAPADAPKSSFANGQYLYFDARNAGNWKDDDFKAKFYFKNLATGENDGDITCSNEDKLDGWVYYALIPAGKTWGSVQMNRLKPSDGSYWNDAAIIYARSRSSANQNSMVAPDTGGNGITLTWGTYCPPMSSASIQNVGTTVTYGSGAGTSENPFIVATGSSIYMSASSTSALNDGNMTAYYQFKKEGSNDGDESTTNTHTFTASSTNETKEAMTVVARNGFNSAYGTASPTSSAIYYEARTPYTMSYAKGSPSASISGSLADAIKVYNVAYPLPGGAIFTRTGYTQTGWATSDGGTKAFEFSGSYTGNSDQTFYPFWSANTYNVRFENLDADAGHKGSIDTTVTFNDTINMKGGIEKPSKTHYDFDGYWIRNEEKTLTHKLIDANGNWIKDVSPYTGNDGNNLATWICAGDTTLYAKWDEHEYDITISISPAGAGLVNVGSSTKGKYETESGDITATANAGWIFKEWQFTKTDEKNDMWCADGYSSLNATIRIKAQHNGTLTAVFEPRFYLVGGEITGLDDGGSGTSSGMPGWGVYTDTFKVITSSPVLATCSLTLGHDKNFYIMVRDKADGLSYGKSGAVVLGDGASIKFEDYENKVLFYSNGGDNYTFKITAIDGSGRPTVSVERPYQIIYDWKYKGIDDDTPQTGNTGGIVGVKKGTIESPGDTVVQNAWVPYGTRVTYKAKPVSGYTVYWHRSSDFSDDSFSSSYEFEHVVPPTGENYVKFVENATTVILANDGNGKIQISSTDQTKTTCGVTTTRSLTAVPNTGYSFSSWTKTSGDDITISSTSTNPTTLTGKGSGLTTGQEVRANFTENKYTITISADATGGGTVSTESVSAGIDTNPEITATPTNAAWHFKQWNCTDGASVANPTSATTTVSASATGTVTAVFEPRYVLVGSLNEGGDPSGGMPSWDYSLSTGNFIVNSFTAPKVGDANITVDLSCACTLNPNKQYKFAVHDRKANKNLGYTTNNSVLPSGSSFLCNTQDNTILLNTVGAGTYTFQISQLTNDANNYPTVSVDRPTSYQSNFGWKYADGSGTLHDGDNGGAITVTASDGGSHTISSGDWVAAGASITYLASPAAGYAFGGWHNNSDCSTGKFNDNLYWTDGPLAATSNSYAKFVPVTVTYNGGSGDGKWSTASNWSPACVPTIDHDVVITKPVTVDIAHATAKSIVLDQNSNTGKLTIDANQGLEVVGTITRTTNGEDRLATRAEDLILESDATGNASLVFTNSNSCAATVKMYSIGEIVSESQWNWQFMGTPFTSANALYSYYGSYLYEWKSSGDWNVVPNGGTMSPFTGYCITQDGPTTYVMDGTLNPNSDVNISIPAGKEFVMANSWTAPISVHNFTSTTLPLDDKTIYLFNTGFAPEESGDAEQGTAAGTYIAMPIESAIYTGNYLIAPMEGFYVDNRGHDAATITLKYDELVRPQVSRDIVAGAMHAPKRVAAEAEPDVMKIKATGSRYADRVVILARQDFSTGFDNGWDGKNLNEPGVAPIIYALRADGTKDAVSAIPSFEGTVVGFRQGEDNQYTFSFDYDGEDIWYLNDLKQQKSTLIDAEHSYSFTTVADDTEARFVISATPIMNMPTDIGSSAVSDQPSEVRKIIINDQLFIIRAGRMYNAVGTLVK